MGRPPSTISNIDCQLNNFEKDLDIAYVSNVVYPFVTGGVERRIQEIGTRLINRGHSVTVYCRKWWNGPSEIIRDGIRLRGIAPSRELYVNGRRSIREAISFSRECIGPLRAHIGEHDIVDVSVFPYFPVVASSLAVLGKDTPFVTTWHEVWGKYWWEYLGSLGAFGIMIELLTARVPQHPVAVSNHTAEKLTRLGINQDQISVIPNGIDMDIIDSIKPAKNSHDILFAGRLIKHKNIDTAIRVFSRVADKYDITFGIIGDGPERERLEQLAASTSVKNDIEFLGHLDEYEKVLSYMKAANIFLSLSSREGFGNTFIEAMAAGCTVISVDVKESSAREVISNGGFTVPFDEKAIEQCLSRVLEGKRPPRDPRKHVQKYSWEVVSNMTEDFYQSLV